MTVNRSKPRILIMCEFEKSELGGGESVLLGLLDGLVNRDNSNFEFVALTTDSMRPTLQKFIKSPHCVVSRPKPRNIFGVIKSCLRPLAPWLVKQFRRIGTRPSQGLPEEVPLLDDLSMSLSPDLIHWLYPLHYAISPIPNLCTVHDLNYEHLSDDFSEDYVRWRRRLMAAQVTFASRLIAISQIVAEDIKRHYREAAPRISTVRWAPFVSYSDEFVLDKLPSIIGNEQFILYPAASYKHKNHTRLIQALSIVNARQSRPLKLVLCGPLTAEWASILCENCEELNKGSVLHLGFVSREQLVALYNRCELVAFPSLFEGAGLPLIEAMAMGKTVCCSDIPVFHEYGGEYPVYFDPENVHSIANALQIGLEKSQFNVVAKNRSWADVADEYVNIYDDVISKANRDDAQRG